MFTILQKTPFSKYRLGSADNLNKGSRTFWQWLNPVPCLSAAHWCCSALLKPVWHDAPWQDTIFSIPQCVTPSRARFYPGKPPPLNALWGNCEASRDLTVQRKISRAHIYAHTARDDDRRQKTHRRLMTHLPAHAPTCSSSFSSTCCVGFASAGPKKYKCQARINQCRY